MISPANTSLPPVITLDGPSGSGKGTLGQLLAKKLGWHYLDSGATYRILAYAALQRDVSLEDGPALARLGQNLDVSFVHNGREKVRIYLTGEDVTQDIRLESCGNAASQIALLPEVRTALLDRQRAFRAWPGLVTDGRDMGTVVFPDAICKFFIHADPEERARRRLHQLKKQHVHATVDAISQDLAQRDTRDKQRQNAPLKPAADAIVLDTTSLTIEQSLALIMHHVAIHLNLDESGC